MGKMKSFLYLWHEAVKSVKKMGLGLFHLISSGGKS